jgi:hypothetical protein
MPASFSTQVVGAKEAVRALNKIEPGLRKKFAADATRIAQPAISEAQNRYRSVGWGDLKVRGASRAWAQNGRILLPWSANKAARSVKIKLQSDRRKTAVILIEQRDAGTAILESAGRKNVNPLGTALGFIKPTTSRVLGPSVYSKKREVTGQIEKAMLAVIARTQKELG